MANSYNFLNSLTDNLALPYTRAKCGSSFENNYTAKEKYEIAHKWTRLLKIDGWYIENITELISGFSKSGATFEQLDKAMDMLVIIKISELSKVDDPSDIPIELLEVFSKDPEEWADKLRELWIEKAFRSPKERPINDIIENVIKLNYNNEAILNYAKGGLIKDIFAIKEYSTSNIIESCNHIKIWDKLEIIKWSNTAKSSEWLNTMEGIKEAVAVISRANYLLTGYTPRFTQIITVLLMIKTGDNGLLMQVATGEGKSLIVSMLAVIKCLQGHTVDIVTSSPILAKRDAIEMTPFYEMFDISVTDNENRSGGAKSWYSKDIVYGSAGNFQGDLLRHEFEWWGTRGERQYDTVIVDEVDNMLIDSAQHITMLAGPMPGFEYLQGILLSCWNALKMIDANFRTQDGQLVWINGEVKDKDERVLLNRYDDRQHIWVVNNRHEFTTELLKIQLKEIIQNYNDSFEGEKEDLEYYVPAHLKQFAIYQTDNWARSAYSAKHLLTENESYIIGK